MKRQNDFVCMLAIIKQGLTHSTDLARQVAVVAYFM